jgi:hypothetical protein
MPPPLAPTDGPSFHTDSPRRAPVVVLAVRVVPPTPVTNGWLAGSSTSSVGGVGKQSSDPSSPDADTIVIPWAAASWNRVFSDDACPIPSSCSHCPHDVVTTCAARWLMIALITSNGPFPEFGPS